MKCIEIIYEGYDKDYPAILVIEEKKCKLYEYWDGTKWNDTHEQNYINTQNELEITKKIWPDEEELRKEIEKRDD